jgi:predicted MFS family arabinose efflux permease
MLHSKKFYPWTIIAALWCVCFLNYADRQAIFSLFPLLKADLSLTTVQLGIVASCFSWTYAFFGPVAGWLGDRWPKRRLIFGGLFLWIVLTFATSRAQSYGQLVTLRSISGLCEAFYFPAAMALIASVHGPATRSRAMSIHQSAVYVGIIAGGGLAGLVGQYRGWRTSFLFFGFLGLLVAMLVITILRDPAERPIDAATPRASARFLPAITQLLANRQARRLVFVFVGANFVAMAFMTWLPTFLHAKFAMGIALAGFSGTVYVQIASIVGVIFGGYLADKLVVRYAGGRIVTQALALMAGVPFLFLTGWVSSLRMMVLAMIGFGFCKGIYDSNIFAALYDVVPVDKQATAAGLMNSVGWLGAGFAPVLLAYGSSRFGMSACLSATCIIYFMLSVSLFMTSRT